MSKRKFWLLPFLMSALVLTSATAAQIEPPAKSAAVAPPPSPERLQGSESEALFTPGADPAKREVARKRAIKLAMAGDGYAAFELGVLFRHGMDHPARAVERDLDSARIWLEMCVKATGCPRTALASLAELELQAGNYRTAMQWAQASVTLEQQLQKTDSQAPSPRGCVLLRLSVEAVLRVIAETCT